MHPNMFLNALYRMSESNTQFLIHEVHIQWSAMSMNMCRKVGLGAREYLKKMEEGDLFIYWNVVTRQCIHSISRSRTQAWERGNWTKTSWQG